jgi:hypothetical protein
LIFVIFAPFCGHINFVLTTFSPLQNNKLPALFETRKEIIKGSPGHNGIHGLINGTISIGTFDEFIISHF